MITIYFIGMKNSKEVDYVLQKGTKVIAIEVKSVKDASNFSMEIFNAKFQPNALYTIGTDGIPISEFLTINPLELF